MNEDQTSHDSSDKSWLEKIAQAFSLEPKTRDDLLELLKVAQQNEVIDLEALSIIEGAMQVADMQVREVMVPRTQMVVVKIDSKASKSLPQIIKSGHSRFPLIGDTLDDVKGILLAKDLLPLALDKKADQVDLLSLMRPAMVVPESKRLNVLLKEFREQRNHMALVIDEYGGVAGLITIEDVLEEIVGEIEDEFDTKADPFIRKLSDNDFVIKALTRIEDFNEEFDAELSTVEFDTIGGLVMKSFGYVPERDEITMINSYDFKVLNADNRRIHLLRMSINAEPVNSE